MATKNTDQYSSKSLRPLKIKLGLPPTVIHFLFVGPDRMSNPKYGWNKT